METILRSVFDEWEKVPTRAELIEELKRYQYLLSHDTYGYFKQLIDCELSYFNTYSKEFGVVGSHKRALCGLDIFRKIGIYNIYNQALDIFRREGKNFPIAIGGNERGIEGLVVEGKVGDTIFPVFDYSYSMAYDTFNRLPIPDGCKVIKVGDINLYRTKSIEEDSSIKRCINRYIEEQLRKVHMEKNPYAGNELEVGSDADCFWRNKHNKEINYYKDLLSSLGENKMNPNDYEEMCDTQEFFAKEFRKLYDLEEDDFFDDEELKDNIITLSLKYPGSSVRENTKYI